MDFKMLKSQEQSKQLQDEELEAVAGERIDNLVKHLSLRAKVARWAAVAASVVGIFLSMPMPAEALNRIDCTKDDEFLRFYQGQSSVPTMCFANAGDEEVIIADVHVFRSGNNAGYIVTNKGTLGFWKYYQFNFAGPVTIHRIIIE